MDKESTIKNAKTISKRIEKSLVKWSDRQFKKVISFNNSDMEFYSKFKEVVFETENPNDFYMFWRRWLRSYKIYQNNIFTGDTKDVDADQILYWRVCPDIIYIYDDYVDWDKLGEKSEKVLVNKYQLYSRLLISKDIHNFPYTHIKELKCQR